MQMPGRKFEQANSSYRYGFNGKENDNEIKDVEGSQVDYGGRSYDSRLGRWISVDPKAGKYADWTPYNYGINNPINVIDPDGEDIILLTWATKGGDIGHTAIAVQDYQAVREKVVVKGKAKWITSMKPINSYTVYELGPGITLLPNQLAKNVSAKTPAHIGLTKEQILANKGRDGKPISEWDANAPDGVIEFKTNFNSDLKSRATMDEKVESNSFWYNGVNNNCTSYCSGIVASASGEQVDATEVVDMEGKKYRVQTPNKLYREAAKLKNVNILKKAPEILVNKNLTEAYYSKPEQKSEKTKKIK